MAKKTKSKEKKWPAHLLEEKYQNEFIEKDGILVHKDGLTFQEWKEKNNYVVDGIEYPKNRTLTAMKKKANKAYKDMCQALKDAEEAHKRFHGSSAQYAKLLKDIEIEAQMPNFGER